jgi:hypothetical protein
MPHHEGDEHLMGYLNVDDQLAFHRKTIIAGNTAMGVWVRAGSWVTGQHTDGRIPDEIARSIGRPADIARLVAAGFWEPALIGGGYIMHDYDDHNITAAQAAVLSEKRAKAGRKGGASRPGLQAIKGEANG